MLKLTRRFAAVMAISLVIGMGSLWAQSDRGTITGVVSDSSGAMIAGAEVTITATATGIASKVVTNGDGVYSVPNLPIGKYDVSVEHTGFKKDTHEGVILNTGQTVGLDISLQVGNTTEVVNVTIHSVLSNAA